MIYSNLNPEKALIWRIVHRDNLPWILDNGMHCASSEVQAPQYVNILLLHAFLCDDEKHSVGMERSAAQQ